MLCLLYSLCGLSYDMCIASKKASSPQGAIQCFLFQFPISSLFLKIIQQLFTSSSSSSRHFYSSLYLPFNNVFQKAVPTKDVTDQVSPPSVCCMQDIPLLSDYVIVAYTVLIKVYLKYVIALMIINCCRVSSTFQSKRNLMWYEER